MTLSAFAFLSPPKGPNELGWLGGYRILRKVEEGGMAFVFDAEDVTLGRHVALKVLKPSINSESLRKRFFQLRAGVAGVSPDEDTPAAGPDSGRAAESPHEVRGQILPDDAPDAVSTEVLAGQLTL